MIEAFRKLETQKNGIGPKTIMPVEYLGHKNSLLDFLVSNIERETGGEHLELADMFCGTGSVATAFKRRGYRVLANDQLVSSAAFARASLLNNESPKFLELEDLVQFSPGEGLVSRYEDVIRHLNKLEPVRGYFWKNYSPKSQDHCGVERKYFTESNAMKIDAVRRELKEWEALLPENEWSLLMVDLMKAVNAVSNIAGTYGCYLKTWKIRAKNLLTLKASEIVHSQRNHVVTCGDANQLAGEISYPIVYADPPYTKRQYAAYYHVLETIAVGDEPEITGSTGLRPWKDKASDYCYRAKAPGALHSFISKLDCGHLFLSYNQDGQIPHDTVMDILGEFGTRNVFEIQHRRYKSSTRPHKGNLLTERLYHVEMSA